MDRRSERGDIHLLEGLKEKRKAPHIYKDVRKEVQGKKEEIKQTKQRNRSN